MVGIFRMIYQILGWGYNERYSPHQRHLKFLLNKQIQDTNIQKFSKRKKKSTTLSNKRHMTKYVNKNKVRRK